jgi:tRNA/rRNA methyltransferase
MNGYQVFHSTPDLARQRIHLVLVRPELGRNVGAVARTLENFAIYGKFWIVGSPNIIDLPARNVAKHAGHRLDAVIHADSLQEVLATSSQRLALASTARVGSAHRPHPLWIRTAIERATAKLPSEEVQDLFFVFGPESDGLTNEEVDRCDWVVTIPSSEGYRSLNLAQAVNVFCYETHSALVTEAPKFESRRGSQKQRLIDHMLLLAEKVGFILPGDPFKMKPRLEQIFSNLPNHMPEASTLHGLLDQVSRSIGKGSPDIRGRYKQHWKEEGVRED